MKALIILRLSSKEKDMAIRVQILYEAICISHNPWGRYESNYSSSSYG